MAKVSQSQAVKENFSNQYWRLNNLYKIKSKQGEMIPYRFNWVQERLYKEMHYLNIILKGRQLGCTTFIDLLFLDTCLFNSNKNAGIIAHHQDDAKKIFEEKILIPYQHLPQSLQDAITTDTKSKSELQFANHSYIRVGTSMRSATLQYLHICLAGDTEILTKNGATIKIKNIKEGDKVLTGNGSYLPVAGLVKNRFSDIGRKFLAIKSFGWSDPLKVTGNHPILTREHKSGNRIWKNADELKSGDYIGYPIRSVNSNIKEIIADDIKIKLSKDLGYLVGFYLAEGHIRNTEVMFGIHRNETDKAIKMIECFPELYNSYRIYDHKDSLTTQVIVNGKRISSLLRKFGTGKDKYIPDNIWHYGRKFVDGLLLGYFDGDGCFKNISQIQVTSTRRSLILQVKMLLISLRYGYPTIYQKDAGVNYGRNCQESWVLKLNGAGNWKFREHHGLPLPEPQTWAGKWRIAHGRRPEGRKFWRRGKDYYWARITDIKECPEEEFVYDIALQKVPHSFTTVNGVVHNSEYGITCARFPEKAQEIRTGALNTVQAGQIAFIESTSKGRIGHFPELWDQAYDTHKRMAKLSQLDWKIFFFPWFEEPEYEIETGGVVFGARDLEYFEDLAAKHNIHLPERKRAWYVKKWETLGPAIRQEYPSTPEEAWEGGGVLLNWNSRYHEVEDGPWPPPANAPMFMGFDYGFSHPFSVGWYWTDYDGIMYRAREWYGYNGNPNEGIRLTPSEIAEGIKKREQQWGIWGRVSRRVAGSDCFSRRLNPKTGELGPTIAYDFSMVDSMLGLEQANDKNRAACVAQVHERLRIKFDEAGELLHPPLFQVYKNACPQFLRTVPSIPCDPHDSEDAWSDAEDHIFDEFKMVSMSWPLVLLPLQPRKVGPALIVEAVERRYLEDALPWTAPVDPEEGGFFAEERW